MVVSVPPLSYGNHYIAVYTPTGRSCPQCTTRQELRLPQMMQHNEDPKMTAFTVTVDAKRGTSTGISAGDRAITLRALADSKVTFFFICRSCWRVITSSARKVHWQRVNRPLGASTAWAFAGLVCDFVQGRYCTWKMYILLKHNTSCDRYASRPVCASFLYLNLI